LPRRDEIPQRAYRSRSPEEWREHDERSWREYEERYAYRRKSLRFLLLNIFVVAIVFFGFLVGRNRPVESGVYRFIDGYSISLLADDSYEYPSPLKAIVKIVNTRNEKRELSISSFKFQVTDSQNNVLYSFDHPSVVSKTLQAFESVVVFDLFREVELSKLSDGKYYIRASFSVNGRPLILVKIVEYKHIQAVIPYVKHPFYVVGEPVEIMAFLKNRSSEEMDFSNSVLTIQVLDVRGKPVETYTSVLKDARVPPTYDEMLTTGVVYKPSKTGFYVVNMKVQGDDRIQENKTAFYVVKSMETDYKKLSLFVEMPKFAGVGVPVDIIVYVVNGKNEKRFLEISNVRLMISQGGVPLIQREKIPGRLLLKEYEKRSVFDSREWRPITFYQIGKYHFQVEVRFPDGTKLSYEDDITVQ